MPRVKRSVARAQEAPQGARQAKGYWGLKHSSYKAAKEQVEHSLVYAYRDRKNRRSATFRRLWIIRINAAARQNGLSYNQFMAGCKQGGDRARPQGARRPRRERSGGVRAPIAEQAKAALDRANADLSDESRERFLAQAEACERTGSELYARALPPARRRAARARGRRRTPRWDAPLRPLGGAALPRPRGRRRWVGRRPRRARARARVPARASSPSRASRRTRCSAAGGCCPPSSHSATSGRSS